MESIATCNSASLNMYIMIMKDTLGAGDLVSLLPSSALGSHNLQAPASDECETNSTDEDAPTSCKLHDLEDLRSQMHDGQ